MRCLSPWVSCAVVTIVCGGAGVAHAVDKDPRKAAIKLITQGDRLFKKGDFAGALARYQEAFQIFPSPKIFYAMAKAEEKLGRSLDAIAHYEQFIGEAGEDVNEDLRVDAQVAVQELEKTLALVTLHVQPEGATIQIDGAELGVSPYERPVRLVPGAHIYRFSKPGFRTVEKTVELAAGDRPDEQVSLRASKPALPALAAEPAPPPLPTTLHHPGSEKVILWSGVGVTGALAVGWIATGMVAVQNHDKFADAQRSMEERVAARDRGKALALTSDLLLVGTLAVGTFTVWWYLDIVAARGTPAREREHARVLVPYLAPGGGGLSLGGEF